MSDKQDRYRERKEGQGFQRVEVLVPSTMAGLLKAYARALRDAHALELDPPLFGGMGRTNTASTPTEASTENELSDQVAHPLADRRHAPNARNPKTNRPDFSKGLLDN